MKGAQVELRNRANQRIATTTSDANGRYSFAGQLVTQSGMTVLAGPGPYTDFMQGGFKNQCEFGRARTAAFSIHVGKGSNLGPVMLPHKTGQSDEGCNPS